MKAHTIEAHGKVATLKRCAGDPHSYAFFVPAEKGRCRFGNKREIMEDVAHFVEHGTLPQPVGGIW